MSEYKNHPVLDIIHKIWAVNIGSAWVTPACYVQAKVGQISQRADYVLDVYNLKRHVCIISRYIYVQDGNTKWHQIPLGGTERSQRINTLPIYSTVTLTICMSMIYTILYGIAYNICTLSRMLWGPTCVKLYYT